MRSTIGRPRVLTDEQVAAIFAWHANMQAWKAQRGTLKTLRQFAKELGVTHGAVMSVIRNGAPKQPSPEHREAQEK